MYMFPYTVVFANGENLVIRSAVDAADIWANSPDASVFDRDGHEIHEDMLWDLLGKEVR